MKIIRSVRAFQQWRRKQDLEQSTIGFVPTMGAFHEGHRSLMLKARQSCESIVVSIFVNPLQFGPTEDLDEYPRPRQADITICRKEEADVVFIPSRKEFYPADFQTTVKVNRLAKRWEGEHRDTHFQGVTTVVSKLLNLVRPHRAFFGQKDYQQFCIIQQLVKDLNHDIHIVRCPTVREHDGLALSSRNGYLSSKARRKAPVLYQALHYGRQAIRKGEKSIAKIENLMRTHVSKESMAKIDYLSVCHPDTLEPLHQIQERMVFLGAIRLGKVRLIDNVLVKVPEKGIRRRN